MRIFKGLFRKKEEEKKEVIEEKSELTELETVCSDAPEILEALEDTMFLYPLKFDISLKDALSRARRFEREGDNIRAALWYRIAGGIAIYEGDVSRVKDCFSKYAKLTGKSPKILEVAEEAVKRAQKYYKKYLEEKRMETSAY
ncbi:MAG: hypothetical protein ACTSV7_08185 [Candidatus Baldrarchaeia archaeon]